eukprot:CAMPEP_0204349554 /NCGR_PEP_ID=MMETSP0469-20131031/29616_1 /ASSEMBLY_ACC=CAM_ASM_000384 /TAXON_ID=2969 /ORGANISM="Oxyrrhis marina" /LENGTH=80 /DNA_ID=CAMNT_0051335763 /DNA_START=26 /DNA_END=266 /DNA_ORIENTATION=+
MATSSGMPWTDPGGYVPCEISVLREGMGLLYQPAEQGPAGPSRAQQGKVKPRRVIAMATSSGMPWMDPGGYAPCEISVSR